MDSPIIRNK
jgi:hypothetical protein